jgi:hypothetical protein
MHLSIYIYVYIYIYIYVYICAYIYIDVDKYKNINIYIGGSFGHFALSIQDDGTGKFFLIWISTFFIMTNAINWLGYACLHMV